MKKALSIIIVLCLLFAAFGCGSSSQSESNETEKIDTEATKQLKEFLSQNYEGTSWYSLIEDIKVIDGEKKYAEVETTIFHDEEGKEIGQKIANVIVAVSPIELDFVHVRDKDGSLLAKASKP